MGKLQTGRFERLSARTYSIKGPGALVDLDETVLGVLQLERQAGMESHWIQGWETFGIKRGVGAVAANFQWFLLHNPAGSERIAVMDWYQGYDPDFLVVFMTRGVPPGFALHGVGEPLDTRIPTSRQPALTFNAFTTNIGSFGTEVGVSRTAEQVRFPVVLGEDGSIAWRTGAANQELEMAVRWAERDSEPFER